MNAHGNVYTIVFINIMRTALWWYCCWFVGFIYVNFQQIIYRKEASVAKEGYRAPKIKFTHAIWL